MGFQTDIADALLTLLKGCVLNCDSYERIVWQLGDPTIECSTLGIGLQSFPVAAEVMDCSINELRLNIIIAQCCYPVGDSDGNAPAPAAVQAAASCVLDDVERILCCLKQISIDIPGMVKPCRPKVAAPVYARPLGGCLVAKISLSIAGVPCCE